MATDRWMPSAAAEGHNGLMTDFSDPATANLRLSHQERDEAIASLQAAAQHGRLTDAELATRTEQARAAVTRGDLAPLFEDLPADSSAPAPPAAASGGSSFDWWSSARYIVPIIALILFFLSGWAWGFQYSWLWFLLVPITWGIASGVNGGRTRDRDRDRDRH